MKLPQCSALMLMLGSVLSSLRADNEIMQNSFSEQPMNPCSGITAMEQQFAAKLSPANRSLFCSRFSEGQRASAMQMASMPTEAGLSLSPDDAVQKVQAASGSTPSSTMNPTPGKVPTGCPVQ